MISRVVRRAENKLNHVLVHSMQQNLHNKNIFKMQLRTFVARLTCAVLQFGLWVIFIPLKLIGFFIQNLPELGDSG